MSSGPARKRLQMRLRIIGGKAPHARGSLGTRCRPEHLIVLGAGYVGLEFAQAMRRFGSKVSVVDRNDRPLHREDEDVADGLRSLFEDEEIKLALNSKVQRVSGTSGEPVRLSLLRAGVEETIEGSHLLVTGKRPPNTKNIGLELAGVELTQHGYIKVNERLETTAASAWAVGEVSNSPHFTQISEEDFRVVRDNILRRPCDNRQTGPVLPVYRPRVRADRTQ